VGELKPKFVATVYFNKKYIKWMGREGGVGLYKRL